MPSRQPEHRGRAAACGPESESAALDEMARDEAILEALRGKVEEAIFGGEMDAAQAARLYIEMSRIHQRRREILLPAIAEARDAKALVEAIMETAVEKFGMARAARFLTAARERFEKKVETAGSRGPEEAAGSGNRPAKSMRKADGKAGRAAGGNGEEAARDAAET